MDLEHALEVADALHTLGAGTPEYAVDEAIGEGADIIRELVEHTKASPTMVYLVLWDGAYVEDGNGIMSVHSTREGAQAEVDRLTAEEAEDRKKRRSPYGGTYYEVEDREVQP